MTGGAPWAVLGQSFGGFCTVSYLSKAPGGVSEAFITGGLPGLSARADDVYRLTYQKVAAKCRAHYERYPQDADTARQVARVLHAREAAGSPVELPGAGALTVERFLTLGQMLGSGTGSHALHYLLEDPFAGRELSDAFLHHLDCALSYAAAPLYATVHEACYAQGRRPAGRRSASGRSSPSSRRKPPSRGTRRRCSPARWSTRGRSPWTRRWFCWPRGRAAGRAGGLAALYDAAQLSRNEVPAAAAVYFNDMYVPAELSVPTAAAMRGLRPWVTSEYEHDGLRVSDGAVLDRLIALARGNA